VHRGYDISARSVEGAQEAAFRALDTRRRRDSWVGELSSSAQATAMSCLALHLRSDAALEPAVRAGLEWLVQTQHADGGWGDAVIDPSNMNATSIAASVLQYCAARTYPDEIRKALRWVEEAGGFPVLNDPRAMSMSGPARSLYALAGFVDWRKVRKLPTEVVLLPPSIRRTVSITFSSILSFSIMQEHFAPVPPWRRPLRRRAVKEAVAWLRRAQGADGSYGESALLASITVAALSVSSVDGEDIVRRALPFIRAGQRPDGSWPIDRDLENFDTAQAVFAHQEAGRPVPESERVRTWFLEHQFTEPCFHTASPPGGWAWAGPAGWPDVDDTAYTLRALRTLGVPPEHEAIGAGLRWLYGMQNRDGSWPTFVRGSKVPFDRGCPYITAHVLSALAAVGPQESRGEPARRALSYLRGHQHADGSFDSLWFRTYTRGTAAVIEGLADLGVVDDATVHRAAAWLGGHQNPDGGWGDGRGPTRRPRRRPGPLRRSCAWIRRGTATRSSAASPGYWPINGRTGAGTRVASGCTSAPWSTPTPSTR
jgi:squalene-hopene/tetraprenyl-beta-curcumene cyclase